MSCLFYCIGHHPGPKMAGPLLGVGDEPVYRVTHQGLSAAVSRFGSRDLIPDLAGLRAYERVVSACHRQGAVIPMRYGCVLEGDTQVIKLLAEQDRHYEALLRELEGCVEMGLRVLLPEASLGMVSPREHTVSREAPGPPAGAPPERLGLAYLTARKAHYVQQDRWTREYRRAAERCQAQFAGLFVKCKTESPSRRLPLLSLYFLVQRAMVASFRRAFRSLSATEPARLLLSGPWPPYNFVTPGPGLLHIPPDFQLE